MQRDKKDSVSITTYVGRELFDMLDAFCAKTGQSKTVAVERAIEKYCGERRENGLDIDVRMSVRKDDEH